MRLSITHRLFLAILAAACLSVVSMFLIMQWSIDRGFLRYVNTIDQARLEKLAGTLEQYYGEKGSWEALKSNPANWVRLMTATLPEGEVPPEHRERMERRLERLMRHEEFPPPEGLPPRAAQFFEMRVVLLDATKTVLFSPSGYSSGIELRPLKQKGKVVGLLGLQPKKRLSDVHQLRFVKEQQLALALVGGVLLLVAAGLSLPLANRLLRPIRGLAAATHRLAAGRFDSRVPVTSSDELGQLARDFNSLALTLEKNEEARRQWVADISHELRTPLAVLRGEIEALQDGVRSPTPDSINSLHSEALRLGRLVDDLYQLSLSDLGALTYRREQVDLDELLTEAADQFRSSFAEQTIDLQLQLPTGARAALFADPARLHQLFANLFDNSLKYTDAGGTLAVSLACDNGRATVDFQDSGPGVPESELAKLFDRLYRVEGSRSRESGGAGLGLAICRNIAEAHAGTIEAHPSPYGGVWIRVSLPLEVRHP